MGRDLHAQVARGVGVGGAGHAAVQAGKGHGTAAAGKAHALGHLGDGAHGGELVAVARNQQHALLVAHVDGQGDGHIGEDDVVVDGHEQQGFHGFTLHSH